MASSSFSHFSVNSGVTKDGLTKTNSCLPFGDTCKPLGVRSISSDLISFSMISARVAGVPRLCFSILPKRVPSFNGFGGVVNSFWMVNSGLTVLPFCQATSLVSSSEVVFHPASNTVLRLNTKVSEPKVTVTFCCCFLWGFAKSIKKRLTII